jgi:predicted metal-dependent hydrolase
MITIHSSIAYKGEILKKFLIDLLLAKIHQIINKLNSQGKFIFSQIKISDNKTRWGSCSSKGVLSFSWRLILVPLEVLDYVIIQGLSEYDRHLWQERPTRGEVYCMQ